MPTSRSTLLRLVRALPERPITTPTLLGVDEFALRRGRRYGTILVDAEAHRIVDLLEDPPSDRSLVGSPTIRVPRSSAVIGMASTPALPGSARPTHSRSRIDGTCCTTWPTRWNASPFGS